MMKPKKKAATKSARIGEFDKDLQRVGNRIKALRIKRGYTSYEIFAFDNNINRAQFGRYERGEDLRVSSLLKILKALKISPAEFFGDGF